jgi:hypothetical protein
MLIGSKGKNICRLYYGSIEEIDGKAEENKKIS